MATFALTLVEGLNAVSIPLEMSEDQAKWSTILDGIAFDSVRTLVNGEWQDFIRGRASDLNDFDSADFRFGYLIEVIRLGSSPILITVLPSTTEVTPQAIGDSIYSDDDEPVASIPLRHDGALWLRTTSADSTDSSAAYLTFTTDRDVNVFVGYDTTATTLPTWLDSWEVTNEQVTTSNGLVFDLYRLPFGAGPVTIPGNHNSGGDADNMYIAFVEENTYPVAVSTPVDNRIVFLNEGSSIYVDSPGVIVTDLPERVENLDDWIIYNNADAVDSSAAFTDFEIPVDSDVYVAFDTDGCPPPAWLEDFNQLDDIITTTSGTFKLYHRFYEAGSIVLGGASAPTLAGPDATPTNNYFVGMKRSTPLSVTVNVMGTEPVGINEIQITGLAKGGLSFIGFPKSNTAEHSVVSNIDARGLQYSHLARIEAGVWENYVPGRDEDLNWFPADLERGKGYVITSSVDEDQVLEIDYDN